jgi:hypothetical protein
MIHNPGPGILPDIEFFHIEGKEIRNIQHEPGIGYEFTFGVGDGLDEIVSGICLGKGWFIQQSDMFCKMPGGSDRKVIVVVSIKHPVHVGVINRDVRNQHLIAGIELPDFFYVIDNKHVVIIDLQPLQIRFKKMGQLPICKDQFDRFLEIGTRVFDIFPTQNNLLLNEVCRFITLLDLQLLIFQDRQRNEYQHNKGEGKIPGSHR